MVDIRFHIRTHNYYTEENGGGDTGTRRKIWNIVDTSDNPTLQTVIYDNMDECFVVYPIVFKEFGGDYEVSPTDSQNTPYISLKDQKVTDGFWGSGGFGFGDINVTTPDYLILGLNGGYSFPSELYLGNSSWVTAAWTPNTLATFKTEVTGYINGIVGFERSYQGGNRICHAYLDWNVHIYTNADYASPPSGRGNVHVVVFYPGNDPQAEEIITETLFVPA